VFLDVTQTRGGGGGFSTIFPQLSQRRVRASLLLGEAPDECAQIVEKKQLGPESAMDVGE
jgi:hypothetical protein